MDLVLCPFPTFPSQLHEEPHHKKRGNGFPLGRYAICCLESNRGWNKTISVQHLCHYPQLLHAVLCALQVTWRLTCGGIQMSVLVAGEMAH